MLHTISMFQALKIWSELEQAYYGDNGYGSDTAEIYAYRLLPNMPAQSYTYSGSGELTAYYRELYDEAQHALVDLCRLFEQERECSILIDGVSPSNWLNDDSYVFDHRCHIKVTPHTHR